MFHCQGPGLIGVFGIQYPNSYTLLGFLRGWAESEARRDFQACGRAQNSTFPGAVAHLTILSLLAHTVLLSFGRHLLIWEQKQFAWSLPSLGWFCLSLALYFLHFLPAKGNTRLLKAATTIPVKRCKFGIDNILVPAKLQYGMELGQLVSGVVLSLLLLYLSWLTLGGPQESQRGTFYKSM